MIRCFILIAAYIALHRAGPPLLNFGDSLPLTWAQIKTLHRGLQWSLALWAIYDFNSMLNRWAENRWLFQTDKRTWNWEQEIAVVTGGSQGIGACVVKKLAFHGINCAVLDVAPLSESFTNDELRLVHYYRCDITSHTDIHRAAEAIRSDLGPPSILVNNAGIGNAYTILDMPMENLRRLFEINLLSHWSTVQEFLPDMIAKKKGHIMSVASLASFVSLAAAVDYSCTKSALLAFHEGLVQELKHRYKCPQIKTTIVHPNWTKSAITAHPAIQAGLKSIGAKLLEAEDVAEAMVKQVIAARSGQLILGPSISPKIRALPTWLQELIRDSQANVVSGNGSTG
ncbi:hypothetical protein BDU57DRAFT_507252 [Ampelomyces quisqualis]|uniref:Short-chain dehydrogenase/reductase 3 n=1 Tax=Ampelomyces quisqualis TaxID=50730 RepID=A0A6A5QAN0_AMPQU|nr:hypothetical protein BDU57DRAFT_507252 [Ampelomyces quisqualis]